MKYFLWLLLTAAALAQVNTDSALTLGNTVSDTGTTNGTSTNPFVRKTSDTTIHLWQLLANPWGTSARTTGSTTIAYNNAGSLTTTVTYTGVNNTGVNGYPFILYGSDQFGTTPINTQGVTFPVQISGISSLIADVTYSLSITSAPGNLDVGYDEWIVPTSNYTGGPSGSLEVFVAPYFNFSGACSGGGATFVDNFTVSVTQDGVTADKVWKQYAWGTGPGNEIIFCPSVTQISSGEVRFNLLDFIKHAIATSGGVTMSNSWWVSGIEFGTEWGSTSSPNYTLTTTKVDIEQSTGVSPASAAFVFASMGHE